VEWVGGMGRWNGLVEWVGEERVAVRFSGSNKRVVNEEVGY
jgi:hypothetical protein